MELHHRLRVGRRVGVQAADEAQLVDVLGDVRVELGDPRPGLAVLGELELGGDELAPPSPGLPSLSWSFALYSKVSTPDIAPSMKTKMIRLAFAAICCGFGARGPASGAS